MPCYGQQIILLLNPNMNSVTIPKTCMHERGVQYPCHSTMCNRHASHELWWPAPHETWRPNQAARCTASGAPPALFVRMPGLATYVHAWMHAWQVCGDGQRVEGDAVVPLRAALLPGAQARLVLRGVYHSMSRIGTFDEDSGARGGQAGWW